MLARCYLSTTQDKVHCLTMVFEPIPEEYQYLAPDFYRESDALFLRTIRIIAALFFASLVVFALAVPGPYFTTPELMALDIVNALVSLCWIILSYRPPAQFWLRVAVLVGFFFVLLSNAREAALLNDFMSILLISLAVSFVGMVLTWHAVWNLLLQGSVALASFSLLLHWQPSYIGPLVAILFLCIFSVVTHVLMTNQRWNTFLGRHQVEMLNADLQEANEQLRDHTERLENELLLARNIQQGLLPPPSPTWPGLDVVCYSKPAFEVGGDFYSYHAFANGHVALAVGDVSGKGVAAALLMAAGLSLFSSNLSHDLSPGQRMAKLDNALAPYTRARSQNCALCYVELNTDTLCVVNAGCIPPFVRRTQGGVEWREVCGFALGYGLGSEYGYEEEKISLPPGDLVVLTSDGLIEARNKDGEIFGFERFEQVIANGPTESAQALLSHMLTELAGFVGEITPHDDVTVVVFRVST